MDMQTDGSNYTGSEGKANKAFLRGMVIWLSRGKVEGVKHMLEMAKIFPSHRSYFLRCSRKIAKKINNHTQNTPISEAG